MNGVGIPIPIPIRAVDIVGIVAAFESLDVANPDDDTAGAEVAEILRPLGEVVEFEDDDEVVEGGSGGGVHLAFDMNRGKSVISDFLSFSVVSSWSCQLHRARNENGEQYVWSQDHTWTLDGSE